MCRCRSGLVSKLISCYPGLLYMDVLYPLAWLSNADAQGD